MLFSQAYVGSLQTYTVLEHMPENYYISFPLCTSKAELSLSAQQSIETAAAAAAATQVTSNACRGKQKACAHSQRVPLSPVLFHNITQMVKSHREKEEEGRTTAVAAAAALSLFPPAAAALVASGQTAEQSSISRYCGST